MSSAIVNPFEFAASWDVLLIGGLTSPGLCKLSGFKRVHGWEVKEGKGVKGSTATLNKFPPCKGTATFWLWLPEHFVAWRDFRSLFKYDPTKKTVNAVDMFHPSTADIDCYRVVCEDITAIEPDAPGYYKTIVSLLEYNPPPKASAVSTPNGSKSSADGKGSGDPVADAQQAEIKRLLKQAGEP